MCTYGYVRVSTQEQNEDRQLIAMSNLTVDQMTIFMDKQSVKDFNRPKYQEMMGKLQKGDLLYVASIDRLPDAKAQLTYDYKRRRIDTFLISTQHKEDVDPQDVFHLCRHIMDHVADAYSLNKDFRALVNPTGRFVTGGSFADTGVTGRKIMCDTYGGAAHHGGGAFSGKDPTKVDRSGAYMARKIAKDILRHGFSRRCEVQLAYAIGVEEPVSVSVDTFYTGVVPAAYLVSWIRKHYD